MYKGSFYWQFVNYLIQNGETSLAWAFQHDMMRQEQEARDEHERLVREITDRVLANLSVSVDTTEAVHEIKALKDLIDRLGK